jgi:hypothetical protein
MYSEPCSSSPYSELSFYIVSKPQAGGRNRGNRPRSLYTTARPFVCHQRDPYCQYAPKGLFFYSLITYLWGFISDFLPLTKQKAPKKAGGTPVKAPAKAPNKAPAKVPPKAAPPKGAYPNTAPPRTTAVTSVNSHVTNTQVIREVHHNTTTPYVVTQPTNNYYYETQPTTYQPQTYDYQQQPGYGYQPQTYDNQQQQTYGYQPQTYEKQKRECSS